MNNEILNTLKSINEEKNKKSSEKIRKKEESYIEGIYIFISFDLTNSTLFKNSHMELWPGFISSFYESVAAEFGIGERIIKIDSSSQREKYSIEIQKTGGFHLWKLVGDEVLLYHKIVSKDELYDSIVFIDSRRKVLIEKAIELFRGKRNYQDEEISRYQKIFYQYFKVKTTVWLGNCGNADAVITQLRPNIIYDSVTLGGDEVNQVDFLGSDIDEGFRLCKYSEKGQMLVSPKLVYILLLAYKNDNDKLLVINSNFRIMNYVVLNGVWEQRLYPLILFCQNQNGEEHSIEFLKKQFEYDAFESSFLFKNIEKFGEEFVKEKRFLIANLRKIYEDTKRNKEMEELAEKLKEQEKLVDELVKGGFNLNKKQKFEFHIACLCYDNQSEKYWITNHGTHGWSFGCVGISQNEHFYDIVQRGYEEKYNLKIVVNEDCPLISFYSTKRNPESDGLILGVVILVDEIRENEETTDPSQWKTYQEARMLTGKKLKDFDKILEKAEGFIKTKK